VPTDNVSVDPLVRLEEIEPKLSAALDQKRLGVALDEANLALKNFDGQLTTLEALTEAAQLLSDYLELSRRDLEDIANEIDEIAQEMVSADSQFELSTIARSFPTLDQKHIPRYNRAINGMVIGYSSKNISGLVALGRLLAQISHDKVGQKLIDLGASATRLTQISPRQIAPGLKEIEGEREAAQEEVRAFTKDPEVSAFVMAISRGQASLSLVTPKVLDWLNHIDALGQFRVLSA
jgi:hypothetical protein